MSELPERHSSQAGLIGVELDQRFDDARVAGIASDESTDSFGSGDEWLLSAGRDGQVARMYFIPETERTVRVLHWLRLGAFISTIRM